MIVKDAVTLTVIRKSVMGPARKVSCDTILQRGPRRTICTTKYGKSTAHQLG